MKIKLKTNYYGKPWTWFKRVFVLALILLFVGYLPAEGYLVYKFIPAAVLSIYIMVRPIDDLALDAKNLYHIKTSVIDRINRVDTYPLSNITSIRCGGIHSGTFEIIEFFTPGNQGGYTNTLEIIFKDNSSKSFDLAIGRKELDKIVRLVKELKTKLD